MPTYGKLIEDLARLALEENDFRLGDYAQGMADALNRIYGEHTATRFYAILDSLANTGELPSEDKES